MAMAMDRRKLVLAGCVLGIMVTLLVYGLMQERIMRVPYGEGEAREFFQYSLFLVFCNRILTSIFAVATILALRMNLAPVAPLYKYGAVSISNILSTTCQYEALKFVTFPVQTLAKSAKMIPVMVWGTLIMQKTYKLRDYLLAVVVTAGCAAFLLYGDTKLSRNANQENSAWGILLMAGYLGFDGFTSTFQDMLFKGYNMEVLNQILYVTLWSCVLSISALVTQGQWIPALAFVFRHTDALWHIFFLSLAATCSQYFISNTIRTFGALTFAIIMTTRQLISILLSCIWFAHPVNWKQCLATLLVFGSLYYKSYSGAKEKANSEREKQSSIELESLIVESFPRSEEPAKA